MNRLDLETNPAQIGRLLAAARQNAEKLAAIDDSGRAALPLNAPGSQASYSGSEAISIPGFQMVCEIHRGGQGVVHQAIRESTGADVAIKVLHDRRAASPRELERFEREAAVLRELNHPNLIAVSEVGVVDGRPYLIMPFISGWALDEHVRRNGLSVRETLLLFLKVCDAVKVAHFNGVIHRDLKPSNIRVDDEGEPHVLDFGLAKSVASQPGESLTEAGQFVGSVPWASPEQADPGLGRVDVRTDVYSLGAVLYQLLTGRLPVDPIGSQREVLNRIVTAEPQSPRLLRREIDDEVETMVLKCLRKDRARRYSNADGLASDIRRYLAGEAIEAKRDSIVYVAGKLVHRHRGPVTAIGLALLVGAVGGTTSFFLWQKAKHESKQAEQARDAESHERARAQTISSFLTDILTAADPDKAKGEALTLKEAMRAAEKRIEAGALRDRPLVEAELRATIGSTYASLGLPGNAVEQLRLADAIYSRECGGSHPDTLKTRVRLTEALFWQTDYAAGAAVGEPTLTACRAALGPDHPETLRAMVILGSLLTEVNRVAEGQAMLEAAIEARRRLFGENHVETAAALKSLGGTYIYHAEPKKAEPLFREAWRIHAAAYGEEDVRTVDTLLWIGSSLYNQYRAKESEAIFRRGLEIYRRKLGPEHYQTLGAQGDLGIALQRQGRYAEAEPLLRDARDIHLRAIGPAKAATITAQRFLAGCLESQGRLAEAEQLFRESLAAAIENYGPEHADTSVRLMCALTDCLQKQNKDAEAEEIGLKVLDIQRRMKPRPDVAEFMQTCASLRAVYKRQGRKEESLKIGREMVEMLASTASRPDASAGDLYRAGWILSTIEELELRDPVRGLDWARRASEQTNHENPRFEEALAGAFLRGGDVTQARQTWEHACTLVEDDASRARILNDAAWNMLTARPESVRDPHEALPLARRANDLTEYKEPKYLDTLALACFRAGDTHGAVEYQTRAIESLPSDSTDRDDFEKRLSEYQATIHRDIEKDN